MTVSEKAGGSRLLTADEALRLDSEGVRGDLIRGVLHETEPGGCEHGEIAARLIFFLQSFILPKRLGTLVAANTGIWLERDPDTVRAVDGAFTSAEREPLDDWNEGYSEVVPDLVVEIVAPWDSRLATHDKALMWLRYGVRLVWVVHPDSRTVGAYAQGGGITTLSDGDTLEGLDVLPGFTYPVNAVFDPHAAREHAQQGRQLMEILNSGPEHRQFRRAEEVKEYLDNEKASWDY